MKAVLEFNLPEDREEYETYSKAIAMSCALHEVRQQVFRPHRKHGYPDTEIQKLMDEHPNGYELISKLEQLFGEIMREYDLDY